MRENREILESLAADGAAGRVGKADGRTPMMHDSRKSDRPARLIQKWLNAGVMEEGRWTASDVGAPQGATISPLLSNVYLHYVFDLWVQQWRRRNAHGDVVVVRFADDCAPRRRGKETDMVN
jgi:retron-type reverse transcriptase